jgi:hypothetical protein
MLIPQILARTYCSNTKRHSGIILRFNRHFPKLVVGSLEIVRDNTATGLSTFNNVT